MKLIQRIGVGILVAAAGMVPRSVPAHGFDDVTVRSLMQQPLPEFPGKEALVVRVEFPPGYVDPPHRHNDAHVFLYVLEGSLEMQVDGELITTLKAGDTYYEHPRDVHRVGRNPSKVDRTTLIVFFVKDEGKATVVPATGY